MENLRSQVNQCHPSFFQVYLPQFNATTMAIPRAFVKNFNRNIPDKITLINLWGEVWAAKLEQVNGRLCITEGWKDYVNDHHSLEIGNFFIFKYLQDSRFCVLIFGLDGCIKQEPCINRSPRANVILRGPAGGEGNVNPQRHDAVAKLQFTTFRSKFHNYVHVPKQVLESCVVTLPQRITLHNHLGRSKKTKLIKTKDGVVIGYAGLKLFWQRSKFKVGDQMQFDFILGHEGHIKEVLVSHASKVS